MSRPTMADVAKTAGVSKATVSRVLNGTATHMRPATEAKVMRAIKELGFRPNALARSLSLRRSGTLALLLSDVVNPFYAEVIHGLEDAALGKGANIFLCNTNYNLERGLTLIRSLIDKQVDGVLLMSSSMEEAWLEELQANAIPTVVLDPVSTEQKSGIATILVDFDQGIGQAVAALNQVGHKELAIVTGPLSLKTARVRYEAFLRAAQKYGFDPAAITKIESNFRIDGGRAALAPLREADVSAVFCCNDLMALGVLLEARKQGFELPRDLAIIGLDDIELAAESLPALSTVALPRYSIGQLAAELIFELLDTPDASLQRQVSTQFIARESA
ncbi:MAG: LacI family DNA-binding transcriptional regulator [Deinococcota bacterium]